MKDATYKILKPLLQSDPTITPDQEKQVIDILNNKPPEKEPAQISFLEEIKEILTNMPRQREYFSKKEAATFLSCSQRYLDARRTDGELPFHMVSRRKIIFKREDLDEFIKKRRIAVKD